MSILVGITAVATLVDTPAGQEGRPSKSLTFGQSVALIRAARSYGVYAYVVLSPLVGVRTEEARALRWDHVDLEQSGRRPEPAGVVSCPGGPSLRNSPAGWARRRQEQRQDWSVPMVIVAGHITVESQQRKSYLAGCVRIVE